MLSGRLVINVINRELSGDYLIVQVTVELLPATCGATAGEPLVLNHQMASLGPCRFTNRRRAGILKTAKDCNCSQFSHFALNPADGILGPEDDSLWPSHII